MTHPTPLWRNRDYMLLWSGQVASTPGTTASNVVVPLLILALTGSPEAAGIAGALRFFPYLIFSLPVGALSDRWDRKAVMIRCDVRRAIASGSIPVAMAVGSALSGVLLERLGSTAAVAALSMWLVLLAIMTTFNRHVREARPIER